MTYTFSGGNSLEQRNAARSHTMTMGRIIQNVLREVTYYVDRMTPQYWAIALAGVIVIGLICMRGFGSRKHY